MRLFRILSLLLVVVAPAAFADSPYQVEMILVRLTLLKLQAEQLGIKKVDAGPQGGRIEFEAQTPVDPLVLIKLIQGQPNRYKFEGATLFKFMVPMERAEERFNTLEALFERLIPKPA